MPSFPFDSTLMVEENSPILVRAGKTLLPTGEKTMTKAIAIAVLAACLSFIAGIAAADRVRDWHDLEAAHNHVNEAIKEMDRARAANHYDMQGHGAKAEEHLHAAEHELHDSIEAIRAEH
jgi:hypothetical protein